MQCSMKKGSGSAGAKGSEGFVRQVRVAEFNESTSFREQLKAVSGTGVYVSVHTSNLVGCHFQQGACVLIVVTQLQGNFAPVLANT